VDVDVLICAGQLLVGPAGQRVEDGAVLVRDCAIVAAGSREDVAALAPRDATRLEFPDATVLPGLIDCHVHLAFDPAGEFVAAMREDDDATLLLKMAARARSLLEAGVTTARDLGDCGYLAVRIRDAIAQGLLPGPRILTATTPLTSPRGHCWFLGGEVDGEQAILDLVRRNADGGADVIKVMASGGNLTPDGPAMWDLQFTSGQLHAIVTEAHRLNLPVAVHAHATEAIAAAVSAGADTIEHCTWVGSGPFADLRVDLAAGIAFKKIAVCATMNRNWRGWAATYGAQIVEQLLDRLRWMDQRGIRLIGGTDAGVPGAPFDDYVNGLEAYRQVGFPADRIIQLATADAADALRLPVGLLAPERHADVLVVDGDPLASLDGLRRVQLVLARGRPYIPQQALAWQLRSHTARRPQ